MEVDSLIYVFPNNSKSAEHVATLGRLKSLGLRTQRRKNDVPTPEQVRQQRIQELFKEFNGKTIPLIDAIIKRALEKWDFLREEKAREYAVAVLRKLQSEAIKKAKQ